MARAKNPNREKAYEIWLEHNGAITNRRIAEMLNENEKVIAVWKQRDKWNVVQQSNSNVVQQKKERKGPGAPQGNKNAKGNKGGPGGPPKNDKAVKHGFFQKFFPEETIEIMQGIKTISPLDILWDNIVIQYTAIVRAQRIMFVRDQDDLTQVLKREKESNGIGSDSWEKEYEIQLAWDKHASFLQAQSRAMATLQNMITKYEDLCRQGLADEEQRLRIEKLKAEVEKIKQDKGDKPLKVFIVDDIEGEGDEDEN